jgi:hypothetical protein
MIKPVSDYIDRQFELILEAVVEQPKEKSELQQRIETAKELISNVVALVLYVFLVVVAVYTAYLAIPPAEPGSLRHSLQSIKLPTMLWVLAGGAVLVTGVRLLQIIGQVVKTYQLLFFIGLWTVGSKLVGVAKGVLESTTVEGVLSALKGTDQPLIDVIKDIPTL